MKRAVVVLALSLLFSLPLLAQSSDFSIVVLPDTQNEAQYYPDVMASQTQWIVDNQADLNIQMVLGEGDIVNDGASTAQQQNADAAIKLLDNAGIPYMLAIGNHDYDNADPTTRSTTGFDQWFGPSRYAGYSYYKGSFPDGSNANFYGELNIDGTDYLFLILEFVPRNDAMDWAESILQANPDKKVILVTHSFLFVDGTRVDRCDTGDMPGYNNGDLVWARLRKYPNLIMVLSGHLTNGYAARRSDLGDNGNLVNQMYVNYQTVANGGDGWLRILTFHPASDTISVQTYSPWLQAYKTDSDNQFTLNIQDPGVQTGVGTLSGLVRSGSSCYPISNAIVTIGDRTTTTDSTGHYSLQVPPGNYTASVDQTGFDPASASDVVYDGYDTDLNLFITPTTTSTPSGPCTLNTASPSVTICTPTDGTSVTSPVQVIAGTTDSHPVSVIQAYLDGSKVYSISGGALDTDLTMSAGTHRLTVQAMDNTGAYFKRTIYVSVGSGSGSSSGSGSGSGSGSTPPSNAGGGVCTPSTVPRSVAICTPTNNASVTSPVQVTAATNDSDTVRLIQIYLDGNTAYTTIGGYLDSSLNMSSGTHRLTVQAEDSAGYFKQTIYVTVGTSGDSGSTSASAPCSLAPAPSVTICTPSATDSVASPVHVVAGTNDSNPVSFIQAYLDGSAAFTETGGTLDTNLTMASGTHRLTVQAKDSSGAYLKQTIHVTVP